MPKNHGKLETSNSQSGQSKTPSKNSSNSTKSLKSYRTLRYVESTENLAIAVKDTVQDQDQVETVPVDTPEEIEIENHPTVTVSSKANTTIEKEKQKENEKNVKTKTVASKMTLFGSKSRIPRKSDISASGSKILKSLKSSILTHTHKKELPKHIRGMSLWAVSYTLINLCFYISDLLKDIMFWKLIFDMRDESNNKYTMGSYFAIFFLSFSIAVSNITSIVIYWKNGLGTIDKVSELVSHYPILAVIRIIFHVLLLGNVYRAIETILVGINAHEKRSFEARAKWSEIFLERRRTTSTVYLVEAFLRTWPLAMINLTFIVVGKNHFLFSSTYTLSYDVYYNIGIMLSSIAYLSINIVSYNECHHELRRFQKRVIKLIGIFCQFIWRFTTITARIYAIILGVQSQPGFTIGIIGGREHETQTQHLSIFLFDLIRGIPRIIVYLNQSVVYDERIKLFYFFIGLEDTIFLLFYFGKCFTPVRGVYPEIPVLLFPSFGIYYSLYLTGMLAMNLFYLILKAKIVGVDFLVSSKSEYILDSLEENDAPTPEYEENPDDLKKRRVRETLLD